MSVANVGDCDFDSSRSRHTDSRRGWVKMASDLIDFVQKVPTAGFEWRDEVPVDDCGNRLPADRSRPQRRILVAVRGARAAYPPLTERPALFRDFADTPPTEDGIRSFANRSGFLGQP